MKHTSQRGRTLNFIIKLVIGLVFVGVIGYQLLFEKDITLMWESFVQNWSPERRWMIIVAIMLMPVCWILEAKKWKILMRPVLKMPLFHSLRAVLGGVAISLFTPNRIGEYGGRILFVPSKYNWRAVIATLIGSFSQNLVNISIGLVALEIFLISRADVPSTLKSGVGVLTVIVLLLAVLVYYKISAISVWAEKINPPHWLRRPWRALKYLKQISTYDLSVALGYAFAKYLVFSTQFVLLLMYFGVEIPIFWLCAGVAVMYLMQTSIPLPPFVDVIARSELAVILWASFEMNELSVFTASFFIWVINLLVPSFFGLIAISRVNVLQSLGYESQNANSDSAPGSDSNLDRVAAGSTD